ncbi:YcxB family protein [Duganella sp. Root1480D1]|uniref:YcxB family protein n=1 Tax=Duganella sp. Root1480D1 TaxID=1736471 RepID=UPI00070B9BE2|nr:YcxB family protein [Duganella sp. Root1480D1]KQZ44077.1 hypothetical protein ASD58_20290 [Duganella sp. Root1480D1]
MQSSFNFCFSEDHLITSLLRYRQQVWWRRPFIGLKWLLALLFSAFLAFVIWRGYGTLAGITGGILGMLLAGWPIDKWVSRRRFRKSPFHNDDIALSMSDNGVHIVGRDSEVKIGWATFTKARRFKDGLLLFQGPAYFNWLPDSAAVDAATVTSAQELARSHIKDYCEI